MNLKNNHIYSEYIAEIEDAMQIMTSEYTVLGELVSKVYISKMSKKYKYTFATSKLYFTNKIRYDIKLNYLAFAKPNISQKFLNTTAAHYYSVKDIIYHELGHTLQIFLVLNRLNIPIKKGYFYWLTKSYLFDEKQIAIMWKDFIDNFLISYNYDYNDIMYLIGLYAAENVYEVLPECFNNYYRLREKTKLSPYELNVLVFTKAFIKEYNKYIPQNMTY